MSRTILIYGQSGSGKTTSCRTLDPETTFYIDADGKGLSWRGWRKSFNRERQNYLRTDELNPKKSNSVTYVLEAVATADKYRHIKTVIVDGITTLMVTDEFRRRNERGYDKYQDLAACIYELCKRSSEYRDDLTVVFIGHVDIDRAVDGSDIFAQVKTSGQKLKKIVLESVFTTVLYSKTDGERFWFDTKPTRSTAKAPMGSLPAQVENDIRAVIDALEAYENEE